jgi:hypothetical protein
MISDSYEGPAMVTTEGARFLVEAGLSRDAEGAWHGRMWTDDPSVDVEGLERAATRMLWIGDCAASFAVVRVLDRQVYISGTGHAPF